MDLEKIKQGAKLILEGIGEDPEREGLMDTPDRIARMCQEIFGGLEQDAAEHFEKKFHEKPQVGGTEKTGDRGRNPEIRPGWQTGFR